MRWYLKLYVLLTIFRRIRDTKGTAATVSLKGYIIQYFFGFNKSVPWPVHISSVVSGSEYITTGIGTAPGLSNGCYIFAGKDAEVIIGNYVVIAPNTGIAGYNHDIYNHQLYASKGKVVIGDYCWIGMNAVILSGVELGKHVVVAAGAVVTTSFPQGFVVIGGCPAKVIRELKPEDCVSYVNNKEYIGYLTKAEYIKMKKDVTL